MVRAVLFDWGNTLAAWEFDPARFVEGHTRGLAAVGGAVPAQDAFTEAYAERILPRLLAQAEDELDYAAEVRALLGSFGATADEDAAMRFCVAEHGVWRATHRLEPDVVELLDALRDRGVRAGLVSNLFDPPELMRDLFAEIGLLERLDALAMSAEVGKRKPHAAIFQAALDQLGVGADEAMMVGDRLREDVGGAQAIGMRAVQATWYHRDEGAAATPDAVAERPADVLRLVGQT